MEPLNEIQAPLKEAVAPLTDIKKDIDNSVKDVTKSFTGIGKTSKEEAAKACLLYTSGRFFMSNVKDFLKRKDIVITPQRLDEVALVGDDDVLAF